MLVQNRVSLAEPKLPEEVRRQGLTVKKRSPNFLLVVNMISPDRSRDQLYLSNYATLNIKDELARVEGAGDVIVFGAREYAMRVWLDPDKLAARNLMPSDVMAALREQNVQVAAGQIGQRPSPNGLDFQYAVNTRGRLIEPDEFENVIVKTGTGGQVTRLQGRRPGRARRPQLRRGQLPRRPARRSAWPSSSGREPTPWRPPRPCGR